MMKKQKVAANDYKKGKKRVNLSMYVNDYEDLILIAEHRGIENPGTVALSMLLQEIRKEAAALKKAGYLRGQQNIFFKEKKGKKNAN